MIVVACVRVAAGRMIVIVVLVMWMAVIVFARVGMIVIDVVVPFVEHPDARSHYPLPLHLSGDDPERLEAGELRHLGLDLGWLDAEREEASEEHVAAHPARRVEYEEAGGRLRRCAACRGRSRWGRRARRRLPAARIPLLLRPQAFSFPASRIFLHIIAAA